MKRFRIVEVKNKYTGEIRYHLQKYYKPLFGKPHWDYYYEHDDFYIWGAFKTQKKAEEALAELNGDAIYEVKTI